MKEVDASLGPTCTRLHGGGGGRGDSLLDEGVEGRRATRTRALTVTPTVTPTPTQPCAKTLTQG